MALQELPVCNYRLRHFDRDRYPGSALAAEFRAIYKFITAITTEHYFTSAS
jgi:hypothetical protein